MDIFLTSNKSSSGCVSDICNPTEHSKLVVNDSPEEQELLFCNDGLALSKDDCNERSSDSELNDEIKSDENAPIEMVEVKLEVEDEDDRKDFFNCEIELKQEPIPWNKDLDPLSGAHANARSVEEESVLMPSTIHGFSPTMPPKRRVATKVSTKDTAQVEGTKLTNYLTCSECPYSTNKSWRYKQHLVIHQTCRDKPFACTQCEYRTDKKHNLQKHIMTHQSEKPFACAVCSYRSYSNPQLRRHMIVHGDAGNMPFACSKCRFRTDKLEILNRHLLRHDRKAEEQFFCSYCTYTTGKRFSLTVHMRTHDRNRKLPFACSVCEYKTDYRTHLNKHLLVHKSNRDMPFFCSKCQYKSDHKANLAKHMLTHLTDAEKFLACSQCSYRTARSDQMKRHLAIHKRNSIQKS